MRIFISSYSFYIAPDTTHKTNNLVDLYNQYVNVDSQYGILYKNN